MSANYERAYTKLLGAEGAYGNKAADRGKETAFGISRVFYPYWPGWATVDALKAQLGVPNENPTPAQCKAMSEALAANAEFMSQVRSFYKATYWDGFRGDDIPYEIAYYLFQYAVNTGTAVTAGKLLQSQLNFMNKNGGMFPDLTVDGHPGNMTLAALGKVLQRQDGQGVLMALMRSEAVQHYKDIMRKDPSQEEFCYGWINRSQTIER